MGTCRSVCAKEEDDPNVQAEIPIEMREVHTDEAQNTGKNSDFQAITPVTNHEYDEKFSETEVILVQNLIKGYLVRKNVLKQWDEELDWSDSETNTPTCEDSVNFDPVSLLSERVKEVFQERKPKVDYSRKIRNVRDGGSQLLPDGSVYVGEWSTRIHIQKGQGRLYNCNGSYAEGYWKQGKLHLYGVYIAGNGDYYEGGFRLGLRHGFGEFHSGDSKAWYRGMWREDRRHGKGEELYRDGTRFEGLFCRDVKDGTGQIWYADGAMYKGYLKNGEFDGFGEYQWTDGRAYVGEWSHSKMHGQGRFTYQDGKTYEGSYVEGRKEGYGVYSWEGKRYEGHWKDGKMHGLGWISSDKGRKQYTFREGLRQDDSISS